MQSVPHPFPYQGSKRALARFILPHLPDGVDCLIEPFCGAAAVSLAAAMAQRARRFHLNDLNAPLMALWKAILHQPDMLADAYADRWRAQAPDPKAYFRNVRERFNATNQPEDFLYLLARIVKGAVRYGADGAFNQSADNRRLGMRPEMMRDRLRRVSELLVHRTELSSADFRAVLDSATPHDLVYMDPPYQGTSAARDRRYCAGLSLEDFASALEDLNRRGIRYLVSYDGQTGTKAHGSTLPKQLGLKRLLLDAGRSTQATLLGRSERTLESLYLSPSLGV